MKMIRRKSISFLAAMFAVLMITVTPVSAFWFPTYTDPSGSNVIVYIGQEGADMYELSLNGVLFTEEQIGLMADRILWTEGQIGLMADRIVYVTQMSQDNSTQIIYKVVDAGWQMSLLPWNAYTVTLEQVSSLPAGW